MSFDAVNWAIEQKIPDFKGHLLIILASFANKEHILWPSIPIIAEKMGKKSTAERHIRRIISALEKDGYLAKKRGLGRQRTRYKLSVNGVTSLRIWLNNDLSYAQETIASRALMPSLAKNSDCSRALMPSLAKNSDSVVRACAPRSPGMSAGLNRTSKESVIKKNKAKKELDKNRSDEKSISDILPVAKSRSKPGQIAVDDARKLLSQSQPVGTLKTSLDERLTQAGHEFKNNEKNTEIEHNGNNGKTHKKNEVENLKPWEM